MGKWAGFAGLVLFQSAVWLEGQASNAEGPKGSEVVPVRFEFEFQVPPTVPFHGEVHLAPREKTTVADTILTVEPGREARIVLHAGTTWDATVEAPGFWVRRSEFRTETSGETAVKLEVWPLGFVVGRLTTSEKPSAFPKKIVVTTLPVRSSTKPRGAPKGEIECPVDSEGRFRCTLPAASFDLSLFAASYVPRYAWDVAVPAGREIDLKTFPLVRGASLSGWVESEGAAIDPERCRVHVLPVVAVGGGDFGVPEKLAGTKREARVNAKGFFQIVGLPPGTYSISADQGAAYVEPSGPFGVSATEETYLPEPFRLLPPVDLEWVVDPAVDARGKPWSVHVERSIDAVQTETVFDGTSSENGGVRVPGQRRGRFWVQVSDSTGQRMFSDHDVWVASEADARHVFKIPWIAVEGSVRLGDEPLPATLWFGGKSGPSSIRIESDEKGRFSGTLSRDGHWRIDLAAESPPISVQIRRDLVASDGKARLEIEIPDTRIFGRVVGPSGRPEPAARVSVLDSSGASQFLSADGSGGFEHRGMAPGTVGLTAESASGDLDGDQVIVAVGDASEVGPVELKLQKKITFGGVVRTAHGVGAGAAVTVLGIRPARYGNDRVRAAADGAFEARLPAVVEGAEAVVADLGSALTAFELKAGPAQDLFLANDGGLVEVELAEDTARRVAEEEMFLMLFQNGLELPAHVLSEWVRSHGQPSPAEGHRRFPDLAPGLYQSCLVPVSAFLELSGGGWSPELAVECSSGSLASGGTLRLKLGGRN